MRIAITGASGKLGRYLVRQLAGTGEIIAWSGRRSGQLMGVRFQRFDLTSEDQLSAAIRAARPQVVIHTAAVSVVAKCHQDQSHAAAVNQLATQRLANLATEYDARLVFTSTDLVFDGCHPPYDESARPQPLSVYGRTKWAAEQAVLQHPRHAVVRLSLLFGPSPEGEHSFFDYQMAAIQRRAPLPLFEDEWRTPLSLRNAALELDRVARSDFAGLLHLGGPERLSRLDMGRRLAAYLRITDAPIVATTQSSATFTEPRPRDVSLDSARWMQEFPQARLLVWEEALEEMQVS